MYADLDVTNNDLTNDINAPSLRFEETRASPYIEGDSADYLRSIIRFSIQTGSCLPVFISRIEIGQPDVQNTVYAITLSVEGSQGGESRDYTQAIQFSTMDGTAPNPAQPPERQDLSSTYYYMYNYTIVIDMLNTNLQNAMSALKDKLLNLLDRAAFSLERTPFLIWIVILVR